MLQHDYNYTSVVSALINEINWPSLEESMLIIDKYLLCNNFTYGTALRQCHTRSKHFPSYSHKYYSNSLFTMSSLKAFDSNIALRYVKCENFHKQAVFA